MARGFVTKKRYHSDKVARRDYAVVRIQTAWRVFLVRRAYLRKRKAIMKVQANVLARQQRRAYLKLKQDASRAQAYIKRYLAMAWYERV